MKPTFLVCALFFPCCVVGLQRTHNPDERAAQAPRGPDPVAFEGVQSSWNAGRREEALAKAQAIVQIYPDSIPANVMTGQILLDLRRPADAVAFFRKVVAAQPEDPHLHALLLEAYAESGDTQHRDDQRALLRRFHSDGKHPAFSLVRSFTIERIAVGNLSVIASEFFSPEGPHRFAYRFDVSDTSDKVIEFIALAAEDRDQASPQHAAAGTAKPAARRYALTRYSQNEEALLGFFDGMPSYDELRARVIQTVHAAIDTAAPSDQK
ncbi:MAG: tetratricopeptide repeat protein [Acidobacteriaceae bacterium]